MTNNSGNRKKALIVSVLAFLLAGGGIFLFFVIQGAEELTKGGKKANFSYGSAAREGVVSLFKSVSFFPSEEEELAAKTEARMAARGFLPDGQQANADLSDWMSKDSAAPASASAAYARPAAPTSIPSMSPRSGLQSGISGGGSKSAGSVTRFGSASEERATSVANRPQTSSAGASEKGTLGALKNARALMGDALRSNSAMTAQNKWNQSFGVGSSAGGARSSDLAYNKSGLVSLDKIKSGEIASLKPGAVPAAGAFQRDTDAEKKDANLQAAKDAASEQSKKDQEKKERATALAEAGTGALAKGGTGTEKSDSAGEDPGKAPITDEEKELAKDLAFFKPEPLGDDGSTFQDTKVDIIRNPDGSATYEIHGTMNIPGQEPQPYVDKVIRKTDGSLEFITKD